MGFSISSLMATMKSNKAYVALLFIQFVYAGRYMFAKVAISEGMNPYVFVFYRQAFASLALAPFAFFLEREKPPQLSLNLLCKIFFVSLGGITLSLNLDSYSMNYISATFAAAIGNTVPAITFIMALCLRMESISIKKWHGSAKVIGSAVSLLGAMVFIFIKGPSLFGSSHSEVSAPAADYSSKSNWLKGSLAAIASNVAWSLWIIVQGPIVRQYPAKLRLTALQTFFSCIQSAIWAASVERNLSSWKLGWDLNLLSVTYCGIIFTGITYWLRIWVIESRGPVFLAMFTPLTFLITALLSAIVWKETPHWGSLCGAILMVGGLYFFLWGKHKEDKDVEDNDEDLEMKVEEQKEQKLPQKMDNGSAEEKV